MDVFAFATPTGSTRKPAVRGRLLGEGSYGAVYVTSVQGKTVAEKVSTPADFHKGNGVPPDVLREVSVLRSATHPCILRPAHVVIGRTKDETSFTLPLRKGTLESCLDDLSWTAIATVSAAVIDALAFAHAALDVMHRDIKPSNVLWDVAASPVSVANCHVIDWGLSKQLSCGAHTPEVQTLWYRAPELLLGCDTYGFAADVWALGCLLLQLWGGVVMKGQFELDQLHRYIRLLGTPPTSMVTDDAFPFRFPGLPASGPSSRWTAAKRRMGPARTEVVANMLTWDPAARWSMARVRAVAASNGALDGASRDALELIGRAPHAPVPAVFRPPRCRTRHALPPELWAPEAARVLQFVDSAPDRRGVGAHVLGVLRRWVCAVSDGDANSKPWTANRLTSYGRLWSWVVLKMVGYYGVTPTAVGLGDKKVAEWALGREPTLLWDVQWELDDRSTHRQVFRLLDADRRAEAVWGPVSDALDVTLLSLDVYDGLAARATDIAAAIAADSPIPPIVADAAHAVGLQVAAGRLGDLGARGTRWLKDRLRAVEL